MTNAAGVAKTAIANCPVVSDAPQLSLSLSLSHEEEDVQMEKKKVKKPLSLSSAFSSEDDLTDESSDDGMDYHYDNSLPNKVKIQLMDSISKSQGTVLPSDSRDLENPEGDNRGAIRAFQRAL